MDKAERFSRIKTYCRKYSLVFIVGITDWGMRAALIGLNYYKSFSPEEVDDLLRATDKELDQIIAGIVLENI